MHANKADFNLTFRRLGDAIRDPEADATLRVLFADPQLTTPGRRGGGSGSRASRASRALEPRRWCGQSRLHPAQPPVEQALEAAVGRADFAPFAELLAVLSRPYEAQPGLAGYADPPEAGERVFQTFCGT